MTTKRNHKPLWATPGRQARLVSLFLESGGFCVYGERPCPHPERHHYHPYTEDLIDWWKADDRAQREAEWKALQRQIHGLGEWGPIRGQFDAIARDVYFAQQPDNYLVGLGMSGLTFKPFAVIRIASSPVNLQVDLGDTLRGMSKGGRRKAIRYGKVLPIPVQAKVDEACRKAVRHYLAH
ncbi:MAG: hypothetical protein HY687_00740 [Chloroflexi bacterium]|nr:hypothetical protein [Chloroflexota bacterium]